MECSFEVLVLSTTDFAMALNNDLTWSTSGDSPWFVQTSVVRESAVAVQSGGIGHGRESTLQTVLEGPGTLRFWWKVASEIAADFLSCEVNGIVLSRISGLEDWSLVTVHLGQGPHTVRWVYSKDLIHGAWQDAGWLDEVSFTPGASPPVITAQPGSLSLARGMSAAYSVGALGTPPLRYQWQFNGTEILGATAMGKRRSRRA
jgi:hypothetical protein